MNFVVGLISLAGVGIGVLLAATRVRRTFLPEWSGPPAFLVDIVFATTGVLLVAELLGTFGWLHPVPVTLVSIVAILAVGAMTRPGTGDAPPRIASTDRSVDSEQRWQATLATLITGGIAAGWVFRAIGAIERGMIETEVFRYHMPKAVRFSQDIPTTKVLFVDPSQGELIAYYPENSELLHSLGISFLGSDFLSHLLNLGALGVVLLAAWTIGRPYGVEWLSTLGASVVLATPQLLISQAGEATTDLLMVAWLLAAVAIVVNGDALGQRATVPTYAAAGLAAGLSLGTKYTGLAALVVLTVAAVAHAPKGRRLRSGAVWVVSMAVSGGYFYVRNLVVVGNPLPPFGVTVGPIELPTPPTAASTDPLLRVLFDPDAWTNYLVDAFRRSLGQGWWILLFLSALLAVAGLIRARNPATRFAAVVAVGSLVGFLVTPQVLGQNLEILDNVVFNVRYMAHGLVLTLVVAPTILAREPAARSVLLALYTLVVGVTVVSQDFDRMIDVPDAGWIVAVLALGGLVVLARRSSTRSRRLVGAGLALALFVVVAAVGEATQRDDRFANTRSVSPIHEWAFNAADQYIGVTGLPLTYGLNGSDLSNRVEYLGLAGDDGEFLAITDCRDYRRLINRRGFTHVVTWPVSILGSADPVEQSWIETEALLVAESGAGSLFAIDGFLDPAACDAR